MTGKYACLSADGGAAQAVPAHASRGLRLLTQSSKRAMAGDVVALMRHLGHDRFSVVGHDRGALVAFRTAMDHPDAVGRLAVMDGLPVIEHLERLNEAFVPPRRSFDLMPDTISDWDWSAVAGHA